MTKGLVLLSLLWTCLQSLHAVADYQDARDALQQKQYAAALAQFHQLAQLGAARASFQYAAMLAKGQATEPDPVSAYAWYQLSAEQGHAKGAKAAKRILRKMTQAQVSTAMELLAQLQSQYAPDALEGVLLAQTGGQRINAFRTGKSKGLSWPKEYRFNAQAAVVWLEYDTDAAGKPVDFRLLRGAPAPFVREAIKFYTRQSSTQPNQFGLVCYVVFGLGGGRDGEQYGQGKLLRKLKKRAQNGSPYRKYRYAFAQELAEMYGYEFSDQDSNRWYLEAAKEGYAPAQYIVGRRMYHGYGYERNTGAGLRWIEHAAQRGSADANYFLARQTAATSSQQDALPYMFKSADLGSTTAALYMAHHFADRSLWQQSREYLQKAQGHLDQARLAILQNRIMQADFNKNANTKTSG